MKRLLTFILLIGISLFLTAIVASNTQAQTVISDEHLARIRSNCVESQASLRQIHASDALLRVNRGQLYELISTKLMAPFNSRISLNKLDGVMLVSTAVQYEQDLDTFRAAYKQYEGTMSRVLTINCIAQPAEFYIGVEDTRNKRNQVHDSVIILQKTIEQYRSEFEVFVGEVAP
jgi:hypothetical protein